MNLISAEHLEIIEQSLGRKPKGSYKVERVGSDNKPLVISVLPIVEGKPFPTTYWLVSSKLKKLISHIERDGFISQLDEKIKTDASLKATLISNHENYQNDRKQLAENLVDNDLAKYNEMSWDNLGIGGIRDWDHIKCLHLHYAHFLARENIIGKIIEDEFSLLKNV